MEGQFWPIFTPVSGIRVPPVAWPAYEIKQDRPTSEFVSRDRAQLIIDIDNDDLVHSLIHLRLIIYLPTDLHGLKAHGIRDRPIQRLTDAHDSIETVPVQAGETRFG